MSDSSLYENPNRSFKDVEKVSLVESIILPKIANYPLTLENLRDKGEYKFAHREYTDVQGKFKLSLVTPMIESGNPTTVKQSTPNMRGQSNITAREYSTSNFVTLTIPKYIVMQFTGTIPAGTEFLAVSIGNIFSIENIRIIGIY